MKNKQNYNHFSDVISGTILVVTSVSLAYIIYKKHIQKKYVFGSVHDIRFLYECKEYEKILVVTKDADCCDIIDLRYKSLITLQLYKQLVFEKIKNNCQESKEIENLLKLAVDKDLKKYKNPEKISDIFISEYFEYFVNLFEDSNIEKDVKRQTNNREKRHFEADKNIAKEECRFLKVKLRFNNKNKITKKIIENVKKYVITKNYSELEKYVFYKLDNLSILVKMILNCVKNIDIHELYKKVNYNYKSEYETKIRVYCCAVYDYHMKRDNTYEYNDITTLFFKYKLKNMKSQVYLKEILQKGIYSFVYIELLKENQVSVDEAFLLFSANCQILAFIFELHVAAQDYRKADTVLRNLVKYHKNDPRTHICMFLKEFTENNNNTEKHCKILYDAYLLDKKYYRTMFLLSQIYYMKDNTNSKKWLKKAVLCCNNNIDKRKIVEMLIMIDIQAKLDKLSNE